MRRGVSMRTMPHGPTHGPLSQRECGQSSWWKAFGRCGERLICPQIAPEALRYPSTSSKNSPAQEPKRLSKVPFRGIKNRRKSDKLLITRKHSKHLPSSGSRASQKPYLLGPTSRRPFLEFLS